MPHNPGISTLYATNTILNNRDALREQSFGFIEYCNYGILNDDGNTLAISLALYDLPPMPPEKQPKTDK